MCRGFVEYVDAEGFRYRYQERIDTGTVSGHSTLPGDFSPRPIDLSSYLAA